MSLRQFSANCCSPLASLRVPLPCFIPFRHWPLYCEPSCQVKVPSEDYCKNVKHVIYVNKKCPGAHTSVPLSRLHVSLIPLTICILLHHLLNESLSQYTKVHAASYAPTQAVIKKKALQKHKAAHMPVFFVAAECAPADVGDVLVPPRCISNREARKGGER